MVAAPVTQYRGVRMPLKRGTSKKTLGENIAEFHTGQTYERTKRKFGKKRADKQAVAAAYSQQRASRRRKTIGDS